MAIVSKTVETFFKDILKSQLKLNKKNMLAPPPIVLDSASLDDTRYTSTSPIAYSYYDRRGSSLNPRRILEGTQKQPRGRIRSASVFDEG